MSTGRLRAAVRKTFLSSFFTDTFGAEKAGYLYSQFHFYDVYQNDRFADFFLESGARKIAIEIDDEASHNKLHISQNKFYDDLLKQNSMVLVDGMLCTKKGVQYENKRYDPFS